MNRREERVAIIGGGLAGSLLAIGLARRGFQPIVFEKRDRFERQAAETGRSINLALAARGLAALARCEVLPEIEPLLLPMKGRMLHDEAGARSFARYGQRDDEVIYSVSRAALNQTLYQTAQTRYAVEYRFESECVGIDPSSGAALIQTGDRVYPLNRCTVFAADGAGSAIRRAMQERAETTVIEESLEHSYKELTIAPTAAGSFAFESDALHIWPRGGYMLIALPNQDRSFTATLFLPQIGELSFNALTPDTVVEFFEREFADAAAHIDSLQTQFHANPVGQLGTVRCSTWRLGRRYLLIGDAAHAIVPFHGQGMNAAFEDVLALDDLIGRFGADFPVIFERFEIERKANSNAIADMAIENYIEMRDTVTDPRFQLQREVAFELERRFPDVFIPRYSMVMFHPEIPYSVAQSLGRSQQQLLERLTAGATSLQDIDFELAHKLAMTEFRETFA